MKVSVAAMQKCGVEAIGALVARDFGEDGVFVGTVISVGQDKKGGNLYKIKYSDGDKEDMDEEEYNYAYAFNLQREGWDLEEVETEARGTMDDPPPLKHVPDPDSDSDSDFDEGESESNIESSGKKGRSRVQEEVLNTVKGNKSKSLSAYERLRQKNVDRNKKLLGELGLVGKNGGSKSQKRASTSKKCKDKLKRRKVWHFH